MLLVIMRIFAKSLYCINNIQNYSLCLGGANLVNIIADNVTHEDIGIELHPLGSSAKKLKVKLICFVGIKS